MRRIYGETVIERRALLFIISVFFIILFWGEGCIALGAVGLVNSELSIKVEKKSVVPCYIYSSSINQITSQFKLIFFLFQTFKNVYHQVLSREHTRPANCPGARFSKVPQTFRVRKAICETANRMFWKADLLTCFQGNKKKNDCEV